MYSNILFATDLLSEHSYLVEQAVNIAKQFNAKLYLLHVIELPTSIQLAQSLGFIELAAPATDDAKTVLSLLGERFNIPEGQLFVEIGSVKEHVFHKAQELDCQLIIIGNHASTRHSFLGNTAQTIINHAPCSIFMLKLAEHDQRA